MLGAFLKGLGSVWRQRGKHLYYDAAFYAISFLLEVLGVDPGPLTHILATFPALLGMVDYWKANHIPSFYADIQFFRSVWTCCLP